MFNRAILRSSRVRITREIGAPEFRGRGRGGGAGARGAGVGRPSASGERGEAHGGGEHDAQVHPFIRAEASPARVLGGAK